MCLESILMNFECFYVYILKKVFWFVFEKKYLCLVMMVVCRIWVFLGDIICVFLCFIVIIGIKGIGDDYTCIELDQEWLIMDQFLHF